MLFKEDALYYAKKVKAKEITVTELVEAAIENIKRFNPLLQAVSHLQDEEALEEAKRMDKHLAGLSDDEIEQLPVFFGIPSLLKDLGQEEAGQPATNGLALMAGYRADQTSNFTKQVLKNGFVIVGRTNVPEFGFKNESDSDFTGSVFSPFDLERNAGGSSGGAAAALKAGLVPIVTASDGGGSIRIPASFNGLIGLKPTRGRMPVGPGSYRGWQGASIDFALTKSVNDTWEMLKAMQVEQYEAPFLVPKIEQKELGALPKQLKFAYLDKSPIGRPVTDEAKKTVKIAVNKLKEFGHELVEDAPKTDGISAMESYYVVNGVETAAMMDSIEQTRGHKILKNEIEPMSWALYRSGINVSAIEYSQILAFWDQLTAITEEFFEKYDALILPTTNGPAFKEGQFKHSTQFINQLENIDDYSKEDQADLIWTMFEKSLNYTPFTQQQNLTGQPAISLPIHRTAEGLPIGTQIWTRKGNERLLLQIAKTFEEAGLIEQEIVDLTKEAEK